MLDSQDFYYDRFPVENIYPHSIELPDVITKMSREITRNATILVKLIKLLNEDGVPTSNHNYTINRISRKILNQFMLWDAHNLVDQEEYSIIINERNEAISHRETLRVRWKLHDIGEEEYSLRLSVVNWKIKDLNEKKEAIEKNLNAYKNLRGLTLLVDIEELYQISKNNFSQLNNLELDYETQNLLKQILSRLLDTITSKEPSTL